MRTGEAPIAPPNGLTATQVNQLRQTFGRNAMPDAAPDWWRRVLGKFFAPVPCMLEAAIVLQLIVGETIEAAVIAALLVFNAALGFLQETKAQATLEALKSRLALSASVRRDGVWATIPVADLVPGDIVKLSLGGIVGADVRLTDGDVMIDQSMLTGESLPVEAGPGFETYAGALIRRGEAMAEVTATGVHTKFGRTAELIRTAHVTSSRQRAVLRVVRNLAMFNGTIVLLQIAYAVHLGMPFMQIMPLTLTAVLAAIPVALPATFTLATALGARALARHGVLPTRLSAVDEAASMSVLCVDKTGTLTRNELAVTAIRPMPDFDEALVLGLAALASSEGGQDPVDTATRAAAALKPASGLPTLTRFIPFDPANKMSEAVARDRDGKEIRIVKGAFATVCRLAPASKAATADFDALGAQGFRVLAVAMGGRLAGLIALSDPPRPDSAGLIAELRTLGVQTVMLTGDAATTATVVARAVGLSGAVCPPGTVPERVTPREFDVFAGILPEDKFHIVKAFQAGGLVVGMCGDGANDAPALRQAQMGIAVSTATDVAKSAAGIVLTEPGLGGIVNAVKEGRITFQRILTYTLRSVTGKIDQLLFLTVGLVMTGHAILTPMLMVVLMTTGDFLAMAATTDNVRPSPKPNAWHINDVTIASIVMGGFNLLFCSSVLAIGKFRLGLGPEVLQTLAAVVLVFSGQAVMYVVRERGWLWHSRPSNWLMVSSVTDICIIATLATRGILMAALPLHIVAAVLAATAAFAFALDVVKTAIFRKLRMTGAD
ncbi:MAG TPA: divalent cation transporter [Acetobacteraceae bacterium]|jgi:H+-transporting ATPase|nr:divalent cation transporter [Acetobacteraceae bacterium]